MVERTVASHRVVIDWRKINQRGTVMKPTLTPKALKLLWSAVDEIEKYPHTFDMESPGYGLMAHPGSLKDCGTMGCIAGHIVHCATKTLRDEDITDRAAQVLGYRYGTAGLPYNLFFIFYHQGVRITTDNVRERVQYWLDTGR